MSETLGNMEKLGGIDYSTEEQWTGLRWIDGKKIYQKTFTSTLHSTAAYIKDVDISAIPIAEVIDIKGVIKTGDAAYAMAGTVYGTDNKYTNGTDIWLNIGDVLRMRTNAHMGKPIVITIQYTKTT